MRKEELRTYIENHESEMIEDLKSLIRIPSEKQAAEPGKPFGAPAAEALAQGIEILEKYGFAVTNYDNYAIAADFNQEEKGLDILAHLDVVPAGEGWQETDPFTPLIKEGKMFAVIAECLCIPMTPEIPSGSRHASDDTRFRNHRHILLYPLFRQNRRYKRRHSDTEIHFIPFFQLHRRPAGDHLNMVQRQTHVFL